MATYRTPVLTPVGEPGGHRGPGPLARVATALEESRLRRKRISLDLQLVRSHQSQVKVLSYEEGLARRTARRTQTGDDAA